jgi:hypothetical protein
MDPLTGAQIQVMERVRERLQNHGFKLTDAELVSYAVVYRRLRSESTTAAKAGRLVSPITSL